MRYIIILCAAAACILVIGCTTTTETQPDGTVIETTTFDERAASVALTALDLVISHREQLAERRPELAQIEWERENQRLDRYAEIAGDVLGQVNNLNIHRKAGPVTRSEMREKVRELEQFIAEAE